MMSIDSIEFISGNESLINEIGPLWEKLNEHHLLSSVHFKERYEAFTFNNRREGLLSKTKKAIMKIDLAKDVAVDKVIGYCLSTITEEKIGEIESLYIEPEYRSHNIGDYFMRSALEWMDENEVKSKQIGVAAGNEGVFRFYEKYGFYPKVTILSQK